MQALFTRIFALKKMMSPNFNYSDTLVRVPREAKIVGGTVANRGEFPFHVAITCNGGFVCGGSILSTLLIITAAHCFKNRNKKELKVIAGLHDRRHTSTSNTQIRAVRNVYIHDHYIPAVHANDIAILVLNEHLEYTEYVRNISLPRADEWFRGNATAAGWGITKWDSNKLTDVLRKVELPLVAWNTCRLKYLANTVITADMICAGTEGRDTCGGDSGGGLICKRNGGTMVLCGVTSFGRRCGLPDFPGVYTRVKNYISWIGIVALKMREPGKCSTQYFYCTYSKRCIPRSYICDWDNDCGSSGSENSADESGCKSRGHCPLNNFRCDNGLCISNAYVCDGDVDCSDRSDEDKCPNENKTCTSSERQCGARGRCIPNTWWCDGLKDCDDNSDEKNCGSNTVTTMSPATVNYLNKMDYIDYKDYLKTIYTGVPQYACLSPGTKILMSYGSEKNVEKLKTGDIVLDVELKPTTVIGVNYEYLGNSKLYGFDRGEYFFTEEHLFAGPALQKSADSKMQLYVYSRKTLIENNPLMKYWNVKGMTEMSNLQMFHYNTNNKSVGTKDVGVYEDQRVFPPETPVYFIQVDSPSGTYFANGYVCKVDVPPVEMWPNTMSLLFNLMRSRAAEELYKKPYSLKTMGLLRDIAANVSEAVKFRLQQMEWDNVIVTGNETSLMTLENAKIEKCLYDIFNKPSVAAFALPLYGRLGNVIASGLDSELVQSDIDLVVRIQHDLYQYITKQLEAYS